MNTTIKEHIIHFFKFSSVSVIGTLLEYILFYFMVRALNKCLPQEIADGLSTAVCYILAAIFCFVLNKKVVFKSENKGLKEAVKFFAVATPKMLITTLLVPILIQLINTNNELIKTLCNMAVQTVLFFAGYVLQKIWVFKKAD